MIFGLDTISVSCYEVVKSEILESATPLFFINIDFKWRFCLKVFVGDHWWASFFAIYGNCSHDKKSDSLIIPMQVSKWYDLIW